MKRTDIVAALVSGVAMLLFSGCNHLVSEDTTSGLLAYPQATGKSSIDVYHGVRVNDHYRWLENSNSPQTRTWVQAQHTCLTKYLVAIPGREQTENRLKDLLLACDDCSVPHKFGDRYFLWKRSALQNQSVLYSQKNLQGPLKMLVNPNELSPDGTIGITSWSVSRHGRLLAYALSYSGSRAQEVHIRSIDTGVDYAETLQQCEGTRIAWKPDASGFYYNRRPDSKAPPRGTRGSSHSTICWHELGTPQQADQVVYTMDNEVLVPKISTDGKYLILRAPLENFGAIKNRLYYRPIYSSEPFRKLVEKADARYAYIGNVDSVFYLRTDLDAPNGRVISIDTNSPSTSSWRTVIPEPNDGSGIIKDALLINNSLVVVSTHHVCHRLSIYGLDGKYTSDIPLPECGTVSRLVGKQQGTEMFFEYASFLHPETIYRYDLATGQLSVLYKPQIDFDFSRYETKQVFCESRDGTKVPMFIAQSRDLTLDSNNPILLTGYGGFNVSKMPYFSPSVLLWLENGGIYAVANIRGGGEYGQKWHEAGMLESKQNVFDDFTAAAQWLIVHKYTRPERLAIRGKSNGGLLVAACMLQHPALFGAVVCQSAVLDMLRHNSMTPRGGWPLEYGDAKTSAAMFRALYAYSPLHNVERNTVYPPILVTTADHDDLVVPAHAMKFVATLQNRAVRRNAVLLRMATKAGHASGNALSAWIAEETDIHLFLSKTLQVR